MERTVNEEKRQKFVEYAGKRVNNLLHTIQILEPMARSNVYDFTKQDVEDMFNAIDGAVQKAKEEFNKKFEEKTKSKVEKKTFSFATSVTEESENPVEDINVDETINDLE